MKPRKAYRGILLRPSPPYEPKETWSFRWALDCNEKLQALLDHYGIDHSLGDDEKWHKLALELAIDHIQAFRPDSMKAKAGAKPSASMADAELIVAMDNRTKSKSATARWLSNNHPDLKGKNPDYLQDRYRALQRESPERTRALLAALDVIKKSAAGKVNPDRELAKAVLAAITDGKANADLRRAILLLLGEDSPKGNPEP